MSNDTPTPTGGETLMNVLDRAARHGHDTQQIAERGGTVRCTGCNVASPADDVEVVRLHRLEGSSDAADMLLVVWSVCPSCGRRGVLTLGYGPNATDDDDAVTKALDLSGADTSPPA